MMSEEQLKKKYQDLFSIELDWLTQEEYSKYWYKNKENDAFALLKEALADYEKNRDTQAPDEKWCASGIILHYAIHLVDANKKVLEFSKREEEENG